MALPTLRGTTIATGPGEEEEFYTYPPTLGDTVTGGLKDISAQIPTALNLARYALVPSTAFSDAIGGPLLRKWALPNLLRMSGHVGSGMGAVGEALDIPGAGQFGEESKLGTESLRQMLERTNAARAAQANPPRPPVGTKVPTPPPAALTTGAEETGEPGGPPRSQVTQGLRAVLRDGKTVFLAGDVEGGKPIDYKQAVSAERSKGIEQAIAEGRDYTGTLYGTGPGGIAQTDRVKLASVLPGGGAASMMTALPGSDQALEIAGRELAAEERKTAIAEAAKPPAQRIAEAAEARRRGEVTGDIRAGMTVPLDVVEELKNRPEYGIQLQSAQQRRKKALDEIKANKALTEEDRAKRVAAVEMEFAGAPQAIIQGMLEIGIFGKAKGVRDVTVAPGNTLIGG